MIADDDPVVRLSVRSTMEKLGHEVLKTTDCSHAWFAAWQAGLPGRHGCGRGRFREQTNPS